MHVDAGAIRRGSRRSVTGQVDAWWIGGPDPLGSRSLLFSISHRNGLMTGLLPLGGPLESVLHCNYGAFISSCPAPDVSAMVGGFLERCRVSVFPLDTANRPSPLEHHPQCDIKLHMALPVEAIQPCRAICEYPSLLSCAPGIEALPDRLGARDVRSSLGQIMGVYLERSSGAVPSTFRRNAVLFRCGCVSKVRTPRSG